MTQIFLHILIFAKVSFFELTIDISCKITLSKETYKLNFPYFIIIQGVPVLKVNIYIFEFQKKKKF